MNETLHYLLTELATTVSNAVGAPTSVNFDEKHVTVLVDLAASDTSFWKALREQIAAYQAANTKAEPKPEPAFARTDKTRPSERPPFD